MRPAALVLLCVGAAAQAQDWSTFYSAYQDGLHAQARGDAPEAERAFTRAAALNGAPGARVRTYGLNFLATYHPWLHLAEAALDAGDLPQAERALETSERLHREPAATREALWARLRAARPKTTPEPVPEPAPAPRPPVAPPPPPAPPQAAPAPDPPRPAPAPSPRPAAPVPVPAPLAIPEPPATPVPPVPAPPPRRRPLWPYLGGAGLLALLAALGRRRKPAAPHPFRPADLNADADTVTLDPAADPNVGRTFGPYRLDRVLGRGGCATAYHAVDGATGQEAAVKIPHRNLAADPAFLARFRREAALGALLDHPHLVRILDPGPKDGPPWLALRFVEGETLEARLSRQPLTLEEAVAIALQVAQALAHAHGLGVVHRDLKPANIMLGEGGATVMDFGIARVLDTTLTATSVFMGTPAYCAPESIVTPKVGPAADRYALGIILFEMLTGQPPFQGDTHFQILEAQRSAPLPPLEDLRPDVPEPLVRLVRRLCAKAPADRPEDGEIVTILEAL